MGLKQKNKKDRLDALWLFICVIAIIAAYSFTHGLVQTVESVQQSQN
jgi:hypothetical protein